jgi:hypothetical protein
VPKPERVHGKANALRYSTSLISPETGQKVKLGVAVGDGGV